MQSSPTVTDRPATFSFVAKGSAAGLLASLPVDRRLALADVAGTAAHAGMLRRAGLLTRLEAKEILAALRSCAREIESGTFPWDEALEDVHTNIEARLLELAGAIGEKIHAGRSRNDQVALVERIYVRQALEALLGEIAGLQAALLLRAKEHTAHVLPGYTHLRHAQPVVLAHLLLAHFWRLGRDAERLSDAFGRVNVSPAGAAAIAGTSLPLDPALAAEALGFDRVFANSVDATSDRDFLVEVTSALALLAAHLSGMCEEIVLWTTTEFGFASLPDDQTAGSSFLPNKRNPDPLELVRGQAGSVAGDHVALLMMLKGLPLGYHRDLQADKAPSIHAIDTVLAALPVLTDLVARIEFHPGPMASAVGAAESSALLVEHLVREGVPYRVAYGLVKANLPAILEAPDGAARATVLRKISRSLDERALSLFEPGGAVASIVSPGGTGPTPVAAQIREADAALGRQAYHLNLIAKKNRRIVDVLAGEVPL